MKAPLWIVKVGTTVPSVRARRGDFEDFFRAGLDLPPDRVRVVEPPAGDPLPAAGQIAGAIVTGAGAMVTDLAEWSVRTQAWLAELIDAGRPVLGVCYGHQLLAQALGGSVGWNPRGREIGTITVELRDEAAGDPLLSDLGSPLTVQASHSQSVLRLPPGVAHLAHNEHDPHQAFRAGANAWGMQFHPEFDADIVRGYIHERADALRDEGLDPAGRADATRDDPVGHTILRRFASVASKS